MAESSDSQSLAFRDDYPLTGETLGIWRLLGGIGKGGMGEVYEAEYDYLTLLSNNYKVEERALIRAELRDQPRQQLARMASDLMGTTLNPEARFAVKVCTQRRGTGGYKRFLQEAEWAKQLGDHPYIVTVYAIHGRDDDDQAFERGRYRDVAFMVMEMAGRDYDHRRLSLNQAVHVVRCIASALDHAHSRGVVHRDLKPENILGTIEHPLLTDFGIAKEMDHTLGLTRTGQVIGTLDYMSPEQATDAKRVDRRSDVYSLGVVLYEFATRGCLPYYHLSEREECLAAIRSERHEALWPRHYAHDFPPRLEYVIAKAMAYRPGERYQSMNEFIADLDRFTREEPIRPWTRIHPRRWFYHYRAEHPRFVIGVPLVLLLLVLLVLGMWAQRNLDPTYRRLSANLDAYAGMVARIEQRQAQQLDVGMEQVRSEIAADLEKNRDHYPEHLARFTRLEDGLRRARFLFARFDNELAKRSLGEFELAVEEGGSNWLIAQRAEGTALEISDDLTLTLKPYGHGLVYAHLRLRTSSGFALIVEEASEPRHRSVLAYSEGVLRLSLRRDEERPREIARSDIGGRSASKHLDIALLVSDKGLRAWFGPEDQGFQALPALREHAAARIRLKLPQGSLVEQIGIWPRSP